MFQNTNQIMTFEEIVATQTTRLDENNPDIGGQCWNRSPKNMDISLPAILTIDVHPIRQQVPI